MSTSASIGAAPSSTVTSNTWPSVSAMNALPSRPVAGQPVRLSASASDPDGDGLQYSWASTCAGTFSSLGSATTDFTLAALPARGGAAPSP